MRYVLFQYLPVLTVQDDEEEEAETEVEEEIAIPEVLKEFNLEIEGPTTEIEEREEA